MPDLHMDMIDSAAGLTEGGATQRLRQQRSKVVAATLGSWEALFSPTVDGLTPAERLLVALYGCYLTPAPELALRYRERNWVEGIDAALVNLVERGERDDAQIAAIANPRLAALLRFTRVLVDSPRDGDRAEVAALTQVGLSTPAVVALAQLIGFVSYQTRLVAGLKALESLESLESTI
ncbi:MAG: CMD domain protein [Burkholderiales bacterium]